jgi:hypothetical protein
MAAEETGEPATGPKRKAAGVEGEEAEGATGTRVVPGPGNGIGRADWPQGANVSCHEPDGKADWHAVFGLPRDLFADGGACG